MRSIKGKHCKGKHLLASPGCLHPLLSPVSAFLKRFPGFCLLKCSLCHQHPTWSSRCSGSQNTDSAAVSSTGSSIFLFSPSLACSLLNDLAKRSRGFLINGAAQLNNSSGIVFGALAGMLGGMGQYFTVKTPACIILGHKLYLCSTIGKHSHSIGTTSVKETYEKGITKKKHD
jgi:hypothetical protein